MLNLTQECFTMAFINPDDVFLEMRTQYYSKFKPKYWKFLKLIKILDYQTILLVAYYV